MDELHQTDPGVRTLKELIAVSARSGQRDVLPLDPLGWWLSTSGLADMCPRAEVLAEVTGTVRKSGFSDNASKALAAVQGTALHWAVQNTLLRPYLVGVWRCQRCGHRQGRSASVDEPLQRLYRLPAREWTSVEHDEFRVLCAERLARLVSCPVDPCGCGGEQWTYEEIWLGDSRYRFGGHPDGFLRLPWSEELQLFEFKTIRSEDLHKVREVPLAGHIVQVNAYMALTGLTSAIVLYWGKGLSGVRGLVEHRVLRDEDLISGIRAHAGQVRDAFIGGISPARVCEHAFVARARACALRAVCFREEVLEEVGRA